MVAALAFNAFALPFLVSSLAAHSLIALSTKGAIELVLMNLTMKIATLILFRNSPFVSLKNGDTVPNPSGQTTPIPSPVALHQKPPAPPKEGPPTLFERITKEITWKRVSAVVLTTATIGAFYFTQPTLQTLIKDVSNNPESLPSFNFNAPLVNATRAVCSIEEIKSCILPTLSKPPASPPFLPSYVQGVALSCLAILSGAYARYKFFPRSPPPHIPPVKDHPLVVKPPHSNGLIIEYPEAQGPVKLLIDLSAPAILEQLHLLGLQGYPLEGKKITLKNPKHIAMFKQWLASQQQQLPPPPVENKALEMPLAQRPQRQLLVDHHYENDHARIEGKNAIENLFEVGDLSDQTLITYGKLLQKKKGVVFLPTFLEKSPDIKEILAHKETGKLVFIPLILKSSFNWIPFIGNFFPDRTVILAIDPKEKAVEYYNPQGHKLENESGYVLGTNLVAREFLKELKATFGADFSLKENTTIHQTNHANDRGLICSFMRNRTKGSFENTCNSNKLERQKLTSDLQRYYQLKHAKNPLDVKARLEKEPKRIYKKSVDEFLKENVGHYEKEGSINAERILRQIDSDLKRNTVGVSEVCLNGTFYDGTEGKDAQALHQALKNTGIDEKKALAILSLLQQGVFAAIQQHICEDLDIVGLDSGFQIGGQGKYVSEKANNSNVPFRQFNLKIEGKKIIFNCQQDFELLSNDCERKTLFRKTPYGILKASISVDFDNNQVLECWQVDEVINEALPHLENNH